MRTGIGRLGLASVVITFAIGACSAAATSAPAGSGGPAATSVGGGGGGGATVTDPCTLLTQAEITAVVGKSVGAGSAATEPKTCDWQYPPPEAVPTIQVSITIEPPDVFADTCSSPGSSALGFTITQVSGVGDGACFTDVPGLASGDNLTFEKGTQVFTVATVLGTTATTSDIEAADKALAIDALGHL